MIKERDEQTAQALRELWAMRKIVHALAPYNADEKAALMIAAVQVDHVRRSRTAREAALIDAAMDGGGG